jgi:hypothetical protein
VESSREAGAIARDSKVRGTASQFISVLCVILGQIERIVPGTALVCGNPMWYMGKNSFSNSLAVPISILLRTEGPAADYLTAYN